jgi:hypothetical protein
VNEEIKPAKKLPITKDLYPYVVISGALVVIAIIVKLPNK